MAKTFGATSTTDEVLEGADLRGKRVLVAGVSAGLGVETARARRARRRLSARRAILAKRKPQPLRSVRTPRTAADWSSSSSI